MKKRELKKSIISFEVVREVPDVRCINGIRNEEHIIDLGRDTASIVVELGMEKLFINTTNSWTSPNYGRYETLREWAKCELVVLMRLPDTMSFEEWWTIFGSNVEEKYGEEFKEEHKKEDAENAD